MSGTHLVAIDQGTTSSRTIVFAPDGSIKATAQKELEQVYPRDGWVEHDPELIFADTVETLRAALAKAGLQAADIAGIGITNQRETTIVWERASLRPIHRAIVWQDRRTSDLCARLKAEGFEGELTRRTGLLADPYFSGTKIAWLLDTVDGARAAAEQGKLAFGTVDSWLIAKLTAGGDPSAARHVTDATNAARTLIYNIGEGQWDETILRTLNIPHALLPEVLDSAAEFGVLHKDILGAEVPILGVAGDQQAATIGQACFAPGQFKSTYGTGCFALLNTGTELALSNNRMLTTIAYRLDGQVTYALEGSIFIAGAVVKWLRDAVGHLETAAESADLAAAARDDDHVYLVPAFTGLGAPYWDPHARGAILGMTLDTGREEIVRAALDSVCFQTRGLLEAMDKDVDGGLPAAGIRVDGGMAVNDWFCRRLADLTGRHVERPEVTETTALGAAYLAGLKAGLYKGLEDVGARWRLERAFDPGMSADDRDRRYQGWQQAVARVLSG